MPNVKEYETVKRQLDLMDIINTSNQNRQEAGIYQASYTLEVESHGALLDTSIETSYEERKAKTLSGIEAQLGSLIKD